MMQFSSFFWAAQWIAAGAPCGFRAPSDQQSAGERIAPTTWGLAIQNVAGPKAEKTVTATADFEWCAGRL
jgi:hypothetical protein